jgi:sugar lactone lactonase YvrE
MHELKTTYQKYFPMTITVQCCDVHGKECTAFCETCKELVCHECILKTHRDHQCFYSDESAKSHKKEMMEELDTINFLPTQLHTAITVIDKIVEDYTEQGKEVETQLSDSLSRLEKLLATQREEKTNLMNDLISEKTKILLNQKEILEQSMMRINSCISFVSEAIEEKRAVTEFFILENNMKNRIKELQKEFSSLELQPVEEPEIHFNCNMAAIDELTESLRVSDGSILHSTSENFTVGEVICFYVALSSSFYKTQQNPMEELSAEIHSLREDSMCPATIAVSSNGFAKLQCTFSERGRYSLSVHIGGHHISGSPFHFYVKPNGSYLQQPVKSITKLQSPKSIALTKSHQIIICEEGRHLVSIFEMKTKRSTTLGSYGKELGQFSHPTGVTVDSEDYIYVADSKNNRIQKFDKEGTLIDSYKGDKEPNMKLHLPSNIKVGPDGNIYVADRGNCRIVILTKDLEYVSSFGSSGYSLGSLHDPWDLAFDDNGFIYITDRRQHCIQVFTKAGIYRGKIGGHGQQKGKLNHPTGLAIDRFGKIYVCESGNHRVSMFRTSSEFVDCFSIGLSMVNPCGIAVDEDGFIYVASNETVHIF